MAPTLRDVAAGSVPPSDDPIWGRVRAALAAQDPLSDDLAPAMSLLSFRAAARSGGDLSALISDGETAQMAARLDAAGLAPVAAALLRVTQPDTVQAADRAFRTTMAGALTSGALDAAVWGFLQTCLDKASEADHAIQIP